MPDFYMPLSGPVNQAFQYWTKMTMGQVGLININMGKSSDPALEQKIIEDVGSYGRQIGQLSDALLAVLQHMKTESWDEESKAAVQAFREQVRQVAKLKERQRASQ
ncbi:hypothetical protein LJR118_004379 [Acidovorax sp. LjRoot118]|uniref:hypothetical protein n=1 Tax=unclassified Acidovorax TaxID=2684926 RepID=UPI0007093345|nr:hypothetical protein [Acidovorax sp. Root217]KRC24847.1 hypothetical protein ASE31_20490 [Acidovorax sp. Root217]